MTRLKKNRLLTGFTIIELLVVVAIIAVLASIVLVNVTSYINKGKDAAIKGNLATMITNAAVYYDSNGNYTSFCSDAKFTAPEAAANSASGGATVKNCAATTFCSCSVLKASTDTFCVDHTGYKKQTASACTARCSTTVTSCVD